jgi:hypothetical protein
MHPYSKAHALQKRAVGSMRKCLTLLKAIVEPDIYTARADRNREIALRWVLRDIKSNRLNWSPVNQHYLRILTSMGLVEMRDDAPAVTNAGVSVIV